MGSYIISMRAGFNLKSVKYTSYEKLSAPSLAFLADYASKLHQKDTIGSKIIACDNL